MKVGDYVRTTKGEIIKVRSYDEQPNNPLFEVINSVVIMKGTIIKSSPNIIDLIEIGDYVNGYYVEDIKDVYDGEDTYTRICLANGCNYFQPDITDIKDIKSIVTKEQFESMEYKI